MSSVPRCYFFHVLKATKTSLVATRKYSEPRLIHVLQMVANRPLMGKKFKQDHKMIIEELENLSSEAKLEIEKKVNEIAVLSFHLWSTNHVSVSVRYIGLLLVSQRVW